MCPGYDMAENIPPELGYSNAKTLSRAFVPSASVSSVPAPTRPALTTACRPSARFHTVRQLRDCNCSADYCSSVLYVRRQGSADHKEHLPTVKISTYTIWICALTARTLTVTSKAQRTKYGIEFIRSRVGKSFATMTARSR